MKVRPLILLVIAVTACGKKEIAKQTVAPPAPTPVVERAAEQHHLAPEGTFYLMERVSVTTNSGVTGIAPGTRVRLLKDNGDTFRVTDGITTFDVSIEKLTDDIDLGQLVARNDAQSQRLLGEYIQRQMAVDRQNRDAYTAMLDQQSRDVERSRAAAAAAAPRSSGKLDRGAYHQTGPIWIYRRYPYERYYPYHW